MQSCRLTTVLPLRSMIWVAGLLLGLAIATPGHATTFDEARHLLSRTGFGTASPAEIEALMAVDYETAVELLLNHTRAEPVVPPPRFQSQAYEQYVRKDNAAFQDYNRRIKADRDALKKWWIREMLATNSPFTERMVLFWHNHFVSESVKVKFGPMIYAQNALFRRHAVGNFAKLLHDVSIGYAMTVYLDGENNHKDGPNENFAREVLELFTMGEGRGYTERDIREAARALTGWWIDRDLGDTIFRPDRHDPGIKAVLGRVGHFTGADVINIILRQPAVARFLVRKLWHAFISETPDPVEVERMAEQFERGGYELRPLLKSMFLSPSFREQKSRKLLIKSPVDVVIGTVRQLGFSDLNIDQLYFRPALLGQDLFDPPNVSGWPGGAAWLGSTTTIARDQVLRSILISSTRAGQSANQPGPFGVANPQPLLTAENATPGVLARSILVRPPAALKNQDLTGLELLHALILDPVYQVK